MKYACSWCSKEIDVSPYKLRKQKNVFCGKDCYWSYKARNKIKVQCYCCGKTILLSPSLVGERNFCSRTCATRTKNFENNPMNHKETRNKLCLRNLGTGNHKTYIKLNGRHLHRTIAEMKLGRPLKKGEIVHHADGNKRNNAPENLIVLKSQSEHAKSHNLRGVFKNAKIKD